MWAIIYFYILAHAQLIPATPIPIFKLTQSMLILPSLSKVIIELVYTQDSSLVRVIIQWMPISIKYFVDKIANRPGNHS